MNLMERKNRKENNNPEQLEDGHSSKAEDDLEIVDLNEPEEDGRKQAAVSMNFYKNLI